MCDCQASEIENLELQREITMTSAKLAHGTFGRLAQDTSNLIH